MPVAGKWIMQTDTEKPKTISEHKSVRAMVDSLLDFSNELQREINRSSRDIERHEEAIESLKEAATKPFKHKEELDQLLVAQRDINTELSNMANEEISVQQNKAEDFEQELNSIPTHAPIMRVG
jgi:seryl-tRNA synthetase